MHLRICSDGHAQLQPTPSFRSSVLLASIARELSPSLDVQEFVERSCSLNYFSLHSCWRAKEGKAICQGEQRSYEFWTSIPEILIMEPEARRSDSEILNGNYSLRKTEM
jgi:hypothetical protein